MTRDGASSGDHGAGTASPAPWCVCPDGPAACRKAYCPYYHHALELIGRRWAGDILRALSCGVKRFSDLRATIPEMSDRMLSERLKELEAEGMVVRTVSAATPVRIEYQLTREGRALAPVMDAILAWAADWRARSPNRAPE
jgi:DNA-binding HxlR family transcriptional regulator